MWLAKIPHSFPLFLCRFNPYVRFVENNFCTTVTPHACGRYIVSLRAFPFSLGEPRQGQDSVIPMYVFGASRAQELLPGCESKLMKKLAHKVLGVDCTLPGMIRGMSLIVPYLLRGINMSIVPCLVRGMPLIKPYLLRDINMFILPTCSGNVSVRRASTIFNHAVSLHTWGVISPPPPHTWSCVRRCVRGGGDEARKTCSCQRVLIRRGNSKMR